MLDIFEIAKRINEAQAIRYGQKLGFPVERHYTDEELTEANAAIDQAERDLNQTNEAPRHD